MKRNLGTAGVTRWHSRLLTSVGSWTSHASRSIGTSFQSFAGRPAPPPRIASQQKVCCGPVWRLFRHLNEMSCVSPSKAAHQRGVLQYSWARSMWRVERYLYSCHSRDSASTIATPASTCGAAWCDLKGAGIVPMLDIQNTMRPRGRWPCGACALCGGRGRGGSRGSCVRCMPSKRGFACVPTPWHIPSRPGHSCRGPGDTMSQVCSSSSSSAPSLADHLSSSFGLDGVDIFPATCACPWTCRRRTVPVSSGDDGSSSLWSVSSASGRHGCLHI